MQLKELIKQIKTEKQKKIVIIGPECSGTTICAYIIAQALKSVFIREASFGRMNFEGFIKEVSILDNFVCQCPSLTIYGRKFPDDVLVLAVNRELAEVMIAKNKTGFEYKEAEIRMFENYKMFDMNKSLSYIKFQYIERLISNDRQVEYVDFDSLKEHKLYIDRAGRRLLKRGQILHNKVQTPLTFDFGKDKK